MGQITAAAVLEQEAVAGTPAANRLLKVTPVETITRKKIRDFVPKYVIESKYEYKFFIKDIVISMYQTFGRVTSIVSIRGIENEFKLHDESVIWRFEQEVNLDDELTIKTRNQDIIPQTVRVNFIVYWKRKA